MMKEGEVFRRFPLEGPPADLAREIAERTGAPGREPSPEPLRRAVAAAFPRLPAPDSFEGCTTHPALTLRFRVAGLGREAVKLVLLPRDGALEARLRAELPGGSYRKETLEAMVRAVEELEAALEGGQA